MAYSDIHNNKTILPLINDIDDLLKDDPEWKSFVIIEANKIADFVQKNPSKTFFPEYTDHDISHITFVINTCLYLMDDASRDKIKSKDAGVLVLSSMLHDIAMHFQEDHFRSLISEPYCNNKVDYMKDQPWDTLWGNYLLEVKHWSEEKLTDVLG
jgi:molecular chaperone HtpG